MASCSPVRLRVWLELMEINPFAVIDLNLTRGRLGIGGAMPSKEKNIPPRLIP